MEPSKLPVRSRVAPGCDDSVPVPLTSSDPSRMDVPSSKFAVPLFITRALAATVPPETVKVPVTVSEPLPKFAEPLVTFKVPETITDPPPKFTVPPEMFTVPEKVKVAEGLAASLRLTFPPVTVRPFPAKAPLTVKVATPEFVNGPE